MEKIKKPSVDEQLKNLIINAEVLSQGQIDACARVMGASGMGWTRENIVKELKQDLDYVQRTSRFFKTIDKA